MNNTVKQLQSLYENDPDGYEQLLNGVDKLCAESPMCETLCSTHEIRVWHTAGLNDADEYWYAGFQHDVLLSKPNGPHASHVAALQAAMAELVEAWFAIASS